MSKLMIQVLITSQIKHIKYFSKVILLSVIHDSAWKKSAVYQSTNSTEIFEMLNFSIIVYHDAKCFTGRTLT